ncbi:MAG: PLP-dependent cysteine synthase family protein [Clostridia bacterium]|nr:PLP-dependent cysteine synthase family protein [Clostridia bacterium]
MIYNNILEAVGHTPLVRLFRLVPEDSAEVLVKFEALNVGGSIKTRTALAMLRAAAAEGKLHEDTVIVEATSGNQGIGLSLAGAVMGLKTVIVMPDSVSEERRLLVTQYGAEVRLVHDDGDIGRAIRECQETVNAMAAADPHVFVPAQFDNPENPRIHETTTAQEILADADGRIDAFCSGIGTGGTLTGIAHVLKAANPDTLVVAIEPEEAAVLSGGMIGTHLQMGIGDGIVPPVLDASVIDEIAIVTDEEALTTARRLAAEEGLLSGISGGTNVTVALRLAKRLGRGKRVVTVLPDTGERYFSTPLFERP